MCSGAFSLAEAGLLDGKRAVRAGPLGGGAGAAGEATVVELVVRDASCSTARMPRREALNQEAVLRQLRALCATLPGAEEYVMVHHPAFRVGKKPFLIAGMNEHDAGATVSINLGREAQSTLLGDARFSRTPYIGQHGWVTVPFVKLRSGELSELVKESFRRVATRKQLAALGASPSPRSAAGKGSRRR
ncbi:MAG TPA: MmcQ/YjbR family DNA-binding protein [Polyangiales bacterium]